MIKINKMVAHKLHNEYGVRFGENGISKTVKHGHYYLCESEYNLRSLLDFYSDDTAQQLLNKIETKKRRYNKKKQLGN